MRGSGWPGRRFGALAGLAPGAELARDLHEREVRRRDAERGCDAVQELGQEEARDLDLGGGEARSALVGPALAPKIVSTAATAAALSQASQPDSRGEVANWCASK
jgi:hypothetical protein